MCVCVCVRGDARVYVCLKGCVCRYMYVGVCIIFITLMIISICKCEFAGRACCYGDWVSTCTPNIHCVPKFVPCETPFMCMRSMYYILRNTSPDYTYKK